MPKQTQTATNRIAVTPHTHECLKDFKNGLDVSFDEAIMLLLKLTTNADEDFYTAGRRLRKEIEGE